MGVFTCTAAASALHHQRLVGLGLGLGLGLGGGVGLASSTFSGGYRGVIMGVFTCTCIII